MNWQYNLAAVWARLVNLNPKQGPTTAILILGQSNATNVTNGNPTWVRNRGVLQSHGSGVYLAFDPLRAVEGTGTSFIVRLGDLLVAKRPGPLVMTSVAVSSTTVRQWADTLYLRGITASEVLKAQGIAVEAVLWMQGEADGSLNTPSAEYATDLRSVAARFPFPFYIPRLSYADGLPHDNVRSGQAAVALQFKSGPDLDQLGSAYRQDGVHFNEAGCVWAARLWAAVL